jgi:tetratricopeptide (TPR) repeat protein
MDTRGKPSKEQLQEYYNTSRKYFDELAEHYENTEPEYYRSVILPIKRKGYFIGDGNNGGRGIFVVVIAVFLLVGASVGVFLMLAEPEKTYNPVDEYYEQIEQKSGKETRTNPVRETRTPVNSDGTEKNTDGMTNFEKGEFYYEQQAYNQALEYLKMVSPDDENYAQAQKYIDEINEMPDEKKMGIEKEDEAPKMNPNR